MIWITLWLDTPLVVVVVVGKSFRTKVVVAYRVILPLTTCRPLTHSANSVCSRIEIMMRNSRGISWHSNISFLVWLLLKFTAWLLTLNSSQYVADIFLQGGPSRMGLSLSVVSFPIHWWKGKLLQICRAVSLIWRVWYLLILLTQKIYDVSKSAHFWRHLCFNRNPKHTFSPEMQSYRQSR